MAQTFFFLLLSDSFFSSSNVAFFSVGVLCYSKSVSLSSYHLVSRALLVYVVFCFEWTPIRSFRIDTQFEFHYQLTCFKSGYYI